MNQLHRDDLTVIINDNAAEWGQPDWSILDTRRGNLPEFPVGMFTDSLRAYLDRAAAGAGVTVAHVAVPLLAISSGLVGCSRMVQASTELARADRHLGCRCRKFRRGKDTRHQRNDNGANVD